MELLIVSGLSGAGKSLAVNALEDIGFYCIDNLPTSLLVKLVELAQNGSEFNKLAVVLDIRAARNAQIMNEALKPLKTLGIKYKVLFLDACDEILERRYKETRRRHPISILDNISTAQAIQQERNILSSLFEAADFKIDTSLLSTAALKDKVVSLFIQHTADAMRFNLLSFGFKYGQPKEADILFDVRCIPNPFYISNLKALTGLDDKVYNYVFQNEEASGLYDRLEAMLLYTLPLYVKEGKSQLTVGIGCTGGKHRSIAFVRRLANVCEIQGYKPQVEHRDLERFY